MRRFLPSASSLLAAVLLVAVAAAPAAAQSEAPRLYVCNQGEATVSVIDMDTQSVVDTVDLKALGFSANAKPHHAVAEPDGSHWYVSLIGENTVLKFNADNQIVGRAEMEVPGLLSLHPTKDLLLVGRSMSAVNPPKSLAVVRRADMSVKMIDTFFSRPHALTTAADGRYTFIASLATNQMLAMNTDTEETRLFRLGGKTQTLVNFAASPDGSTVIAGGQVTGQLLVFDTSSPTETAVTDTISVGAQPWHPVIHPDGKTAYVPLKADNAIAVVDLESRTVTTRITGNGLAQPHGTTLSPDGRYLFVSNNNRKGAYTPTGDNPDAGTITVIDTETNEIASVIEVGTYPTGIGSFGGARATTMSDAD
jgi:YVTN family beta-propeller protein